MKSIPKPENRLASFRPRFSRHVCGQPVDTRSKRRGFQYSGILLPLFQGFVAPLALLIWLSSGAVATSSIAQDDSPSTTSSDDTEVDGSKLLSPASFGFNIPVASVAACEWTTVETTEEDQNVIAKVHVKVGENFVVMLPDGRLVARTADQVQPSDQTFKPSEPSAIGRGLLSGELARFSGMKMEKTKHYIFLYNTSPQFAKVTKKILQSMIGGVETFVEDQGITTHDPPVPLVVIMFATEREFQAYRQMPNGLLAYYNMVTNRVVLHEESSLADTRPDLARGQLLSTIAHEGAHQILHNIGVQQRLSLWPMWLSEGLAEFFAPTSFGRRNRWKGAGDVNDLRMFELETYLQSQYISGFNGDTITGAVAAGRLDSTGYATAWAIVHFLANQHKRGFDDLVGRMSHLGPMRGMAAREGNPVIENLQHFEELFGDEMGKTETAMVDYLSGLKYASPFADYVHYVGMASITVDGQVKRLACFFHTLQKVEKWKESLRDSFTIEQLHNANWEVKEFSSRGAANQAIRRFLK